MKVTLTALLLLTLSPAFSQSGDKAKGVVKAKNSGLKEAQASQKKIDGFANETSAMLTKYRQTIQQIENAKIYNKQLSGIIQTQTEEKVSIAKQIQDLKDTNKGIVPLMVAMVDNMKSFVSLDVPFLPEERNKRMSDLDGLMKRADISTSEKFRRILEAYQVENEYGRTIEAYKAIKENNGKEMTVDYLRIGRVALIYQTLDAKEAGVWNKKTKSWDMLDSSFKKSIQTGIKIARKQSAPQLIKLPIFAGVSI